MGTPQAFRTLAPTMNCTFCTGLQCRGFEVVIISSVIQTDLPSASPAFGGLFSGTRRNWAGIYPLAARSRLLPLPADLPSSCGGRTRTRRSIAMDPQAQALSRNTGPRLDIQSA